MWRKSGVQSLDGQFYFRYLYWNWKYTNTNIGIMQEIQSRGK